MSKQIKRWDDGLPNTALWAPRVPGGAALALRQALQLTCRATQERIVKEAEVERSFNIDNFDSGSGVEDLERRELRSLLPTRYEVETGVVNDSNGHTAGDCDILITNRMWAPAVKQGATEKSRRQHVPIEAVYSIIEVKQSGTFAALDDAMKKLVTGSRLRRADNPYGHITENQHLLFLDKPSYLLNPLFTVAFMARPDPEGPFVDLAKRFFLINSMTAAGTHRDHVVKMLCVLNAGIAYYGVQTGLTTQNADFSRDRHLDLIETTTSVQDDCVYVFYTQLLGHLTRSVLDILDIPLLYGAYEKVTVHHHNKIPATPDITPGPPNIGG
jgi:hypothetical protein